MDLKTRAPKKRKRSEKPLWKLAYLTKAEDEGRKFLNDEQYEHVVGLFDELAFETQPTKSKTQDVRSIENFYELRDKGGVLGRINVRVYFTVLKGRALIVALSSYKKEDDGQVAGHVKSRVRNRLRMLDKLLKDGDI